MSRPSPACLICNCSRHQFYLTVGNRFDPGETFQLVRCERCGFVYLNPRPDPATLSRYYEHEEYQPHKVLRRSLFDRAYDYFRTWNIRYKRYIIERHVWRGAVLDYGCGSGEFLLAMRAAGWRVCGVEPVFRPRNHAAAAGLPIHATLASVKARFDVITLWHVLEHIDHVHQWFERMKNHLRTPGILVVAVPNISCFDARRYGKYWVALDAPRHLYHFRPLDLQRLARKHGFRIREMHTLLLDTWFNSLLSWRLESQKFGIFKFWTGLPKFITTALISTIKETLDRSLGSSVMYVLERR